MSRVPKLRFKEFSGEWEEKKFGTFGRLINGLTYSPNDIVEDGLLVLRSSNIQNNQVVFEDNVFVNMNIQEDALTKENDILICVRNGSKRLIGKSVLIPRNIPLSTHGAFMTVFRGDANQFLIHWMQTPMFFKQVHQNLGATINSINGSDLKKFKITAPSKNEQQRIASFLSAIDTKIDQLTRKKELLEQYKKGVMQKIFSQELRFKADDGSEFPEWEEKQLKQLGVTYNGLTGKTADDFGTGKPYIQYKQIFDKSKIDIKNFGYVDIKPNDKQNKAQYGDVFFTVSSETPAEVGFASVLLDHIEDVYLNSFCFGFRTSDTILNPLFSQYLFRSAFFRKDVIKLAQGSTRYNISKTEFMKIKISIPSIQEQTKIANFLSAIDTKIDIVAQQLNEAKNFKKGLLQQMFV